MMTQEIEVDEDEAEYEKSVGEVRDKAATVELLDRAGSQVEAAVYQLFDEILGSCHARLLMDPVTRKLGTGGQAPNYRVAMRANLHGDEGTGRVDRVVVAIAKEADWLEHQLDLRFELNEQVWEACVDPQRRFIVDEAWETVRAKLDRQGRQRLDDHERRLFAKGQPDVRVHSAVVERHGAAFVEVERLGRAVRDAKIQHQQSFDFRAQKPAPPAPVEAPEPEEPIDPEVARAELEAAAKEAKAKKHHKMKLVGAQV